MEIAPIPSEDLPKPATTDDPDQNQLTDAPIHSFSELEQENAVSEKEARGILEVIASTGRFWQEWDKLKAILSFQLKQVLSEYPEAKMTTESQIASFAELMKGLDEALHAFDQGPPFTLQRLCEILLDARSIYPNLSKLAAALEKNLLVTSMLSMSTDAYPKALADPKKEAEEQDSATNGGLISEDSDTIMTEAETTTRTSPVAAS